MSNHIYVYLIINVGKRWVNLKEFIGESLGNTLEKRFNELTNGEFKDLIKMIPMNRRYNRYFEELLTLATMYPHYKAVITERNSL